MQLTTEITIKAPIEKIWANLKDFNSYKDWNPFMHIEGKLQLDERPIVTIYPPEKKKVVFKPRIISLIENKEFIWLGTLLVPGIFDGKHKFLLKRLGDSQVQFVNSEEFSGLLSKPIFKTISEATYLGFQQMNTALKQRCEA